MQHTKPAHASERSHGVKNSTTSAREDNQAAIATEPHQSPTKDRNEAQYTTFSETGPSGGMMYSFGMSQGDVPLWAASHVKAASLEERRRHKGT
ncbi:hypothetical protein J8273_8911 [Carpediemonas membranifera]|uniref:Uncharacterized protein n=1 Tax=Carpediemonas membranifera TaxID=201153 RepID=A0A8J6DYP2_9EUKA|nr:hypothetical protein J8273_8911 [Carpediemonas membranifera]|eukprot:KAG9389618.1 hypothetical protein J8273_8911 [Carpediemonas membranifera]